MLGMWALDFAPTKDLEEFYIWYNKYDEDSFILVSFEYWVRNVKK